MGTCSSFLTTQGHRVRTPLSAATTTKMVKGRHRKPQMTQLPAGARAMTGKAKSATKSQTYSRLLPVQVVVNDSSNKWKGKGPAATATTNAYQFPAWANYLLCLCGYPSTTSSSSSSSASKWEPDFVVGRWDPISASVYLEVTRPKSGRKVGTVHDGDESNDDDQSASMRYLWESGFFGKGTLSRSEPTWHRRQTNAIRVKRARERGGKVFTPEELTALRRKERKAAKIERARLAVKAGQQLADGIVALGGKLTEEEEKLIERAAEREIKEEEEEAKDESAYGKHIPGLIYLKPQEEEQKAQVDAGAVADLAVIEVDEEEYIDVDDMERLQLSSYETLFLAGMLGVLHVVDEEDQEISIEHLYSLLMATVLPHSALKLSPFTVPTLPQLQMAAQQWSRPDNPFLLNYIAYHHYRSLGWVVKNGIKFCADFLLYKKGPAFSHAEFAVVIIPVYEDPEDEKSSPFRKHPNGNERNWVWFSSVNRVNTQVLKTVVLCHVTIPAMSTLDQTTLASPQAFVEGLLQKKLHHIREYTIRRFTPQRMRA